MAGKYQTYSQYQDTGVEWLGEIPGHWAVKKLKFLASIQPSNVDKKTKDGEIDVKLCNYTDVYYNDKVDESLEYMAASATEEQIEKFTLKAGDTIITKDSEDPTDIAIPTYVPSALSGVVCGYHLALIRPFNSSYGSFIKRVFEAGYARAYFCTRSNGLTRYGLGSYPLSNVFYPKPPKEEAEAIANFLDHETAKIDTLIAKQQQLIKLLKEKRQAVISHAVTKGLNPDAPMKDSGVEWLGEVPEHWMTPALKYMCSLLKDGTHLPPPRVDEGIPLLSVRNLIGGKFVMRNDDSKISYYDFLKLNQSFKVLEGDVLLAVVGATLGKTAIVGKMDLFHIQRSVAIFRCKTSSLVNEFLNLIFQSKPFDELLWSNVGFSAQPGIYLGALANFRMPIPPIEEQKQIVNKVSKVTSVYDKLLLVATKKIELLQERRTAIISAAVTGKIDVRNWHPEHTEIPMEASA